MWVENRGVMRPVMRLRTAPAGTHVGLQAPHQPQFTATYYTEINACSVLVSKLQPPNSCFRRKNGGQFWSVEIVPASETSGCGSTRKSVKVAKGLTPGGPRSEGDGECAHVSHTTDHGSGQLQQHITVAKVQPIVGAELPVQ